MAEPGPRQTFASSLVRVSFPSGDWMVCIVDLKTSALNMGVTLVLPSQTIPFVVLSIVKPSFHNAPYVIVKDDEGSYGEVGPNVGFGVRNFPGHAGRGTINGQLWVKLNSALPKEPFPVVFQYTTNHPTLGTGDIELFYVATIRGNPTVGGVLSGPDPVSIFEGAQVEGDPDDDRIVSVESAATDTDDVTRTFTFMVHPDTLAVDAATG